MSTVFLLSTNQQHFDVALYKTLFFKGCGVDLSNSFAKKTEILAITNHERWEGGTERNLIETNLDIQHDLFYTFVILLPEEQALNIFSPLALNVCFMNNRIQLVRVSGTLADWLRIVNQHCHREQKSVLLSTLHQILAHFEKLGLSSIFNSQIKCIS